MSDIIQTNCHGRRSRGSAQHSRKNKGFFIKPYIELREQIGRNEVNNITDRSSSNIFNGIVWTIVVFNKNRKLLKFSISKNASNCRSTVRIFRDEVDTGNALTLPWKISNDLPASCNTHITRENREEYERVLALSYIGELFAVARNSITIRKGTNGEMFFIFTFNESDSVYIIPWRTLTEHNIISIPFDGLNRYKFLITFYSDQYSNLEGEMFRLEARSWNDIRSAKVIL